MNGVAGLARRIPRDRDPEWKMIEYARETGRQTFF
jgi:hypothetical protein